MRIGISGIHYPLSMMTYFIRAFQRRDDIELITVGPFTGSWIPWNGGMDVSVKNLHFPTIQLPKELIGNKIPFSQIEKKLPEKIDLWLEIDAGWHFITRPKADVVCLIETDPHVLRHHYDEIADRNDIVFCMQTPYMPDKKNYVHLPYAFDPTVHYPEEHPILFDACLIGLLYDHRKKLIDMLRSHGKKVYYSIGEIFDDYRRRYRSSKFALSWSSLHDTPARVFEAFGMKVPLVCNYTPDLQRMFVDGEHYIGFSSVDDAIQKIEFYLENYSEAYRIADNAYNESKDNHTWDKRVEQILEAVSR